MVMKPKYKQPCLADVHMILTDLEPFIQPFFPVCVQGPNLHDTTPVSRTITSGEKEPKTALYGYSIKWEGILGHP